jgi:hypothetical protein
MTDISIRMKLISHIHTNGYAIFDIICSPLLLKIPEHWNACSNTIQCQSPIQLVFQCLKCKLSHRVRSGL